LKISNTEIEDKEHMTNVFNEYFISVAQTIVDDLNRDNKKIGTRINPLHSLNNKYGPTFEPIKWHYTSTTDIKKINKSLKTKSSYGYNNISTRILKISIPYITSPLSYICNQSLAQGIFPDRLEFALLSQFLKIVVNMNHLTTHKYHCCQLFQKYSRLYTIDCMNTNRNHILDDNQYGFRPSFSTEKASFKLKIRVVWNHW
jgi:hypothetical protein